MKVKIDSPMGRRQYSKRLGADLIAAYSISSIYNDLAVKVTAVTGASK